MAKKIKKSNKVAVSGVVIKAEYGSSKNTAAHRFQLVVALDEGNVLNRDHVSVYPNEWAKEAQFNWVSAGNVSPGQKVKLSGIPHSYVRSSGSSAVGLNSLTLTLV